MEQLQTVGMVSKNLGVSNRMLRYYEQIGLIQSRRVEGYAYRVYDDEAVRRVRQIIVLRKLHVSVKQICEILSSSEAASVIEVFERNIGELDEEITALATIRAILRNLVDELRDKANMRLQLDWISGSSAISLADALSFPKNTLQSENSIENLSKASEKLYKLTDRDVRIVYLPPMTVASIHIVGQDVQGNHAEHTSAIILDEFIRDANLKTAYPAARNFGFNNPDAISDDDPNHGYERWVSIPDDMEVPAPLVKKRLEGGMYAAHVIPYGAWDEGWMPLYRWVEENNDRFIGRWGTIDGVCGWLEEHLNFWDWKDDYEGKAANQVDLLMPVKPRFAAGTRHPQEHIVETFNYNGIPVEVVEWDETIWCGKIGYAAGNVGE